MAYTWLADIHLEFLPDQEGDHSIEAAARQCDALSLTGDISVASWLEFHLRLLERCRCPVYFVLGNHNYYGGAIATVREMVEGICDSSYRLHWLPAAGVVPLSRLSGRPAGMKAASPPTTGCHILPAVQSVRCCARSCSIGRSGR